MVSSLLSATARISLRNICTKTTEYFNFNSSSISTGTFSRCHLSNCLGPKKTKEAIMKMEKGIEQWIGHLAKRLYIQMNGDKNGNNYLLGDNSKQKRRSIYTPARIFPGNIF
jgi:hypothetical protein